MKKAVMIGAGQIGRGFIGMLLEKAGFHVVFADINMDVINDINTRHEYTVHLVDTECEDTVVRNISAVNSLSADLIDHYSDCNLICTSVGLTAFPYIAPALAAGIEKRMQTGNRESLNIIGCENGIHATSKLKQQVYQLLSQEAIAYADRCIGFPDCAVDRIIPPVSGLSAAEVVVEKYHEWDVDKFGFKGKIPVIPGMNVVDNLSAYVERKLFTLNGPNAVTGCLGYLKGIQTIRESLADNEIFEVVWGMMEECSQMLEKRHGFATEEMLEYRIKLMERFKNPFIVDPVTRVAREPVRKLAKDDRIILPLTFAHEFNIDTPHYYTGIAAVLLYDNPEDAQSANIRSMIREKGAAVALEELTGISTDSDVSTMILSEYYGLEKRLGVSI